MAAWISLFITKLFGRLSLTKGKVNTNCAKRISVVFSSRNSINAGENT